MRWSGSDSLTRCLTQLLQVRSALLGRQPACNVRYAFASGLLVPDIFACQRTRGSCTERHRMATSRWRAAQRHLTLEAI